MKNISFEQKQREAFYLIKKYCSLTWYEEVFRLWTRFCVGYEDMLRHPDDYNLGEVTPWWEGNFRMFWGYASDMEEGLVALRRGDKALGYEFLAGGCRFNQWLYSRRFLEMDLSELGYRHCKADGPSEGIFSYAERAYDMAMADCIFRHTDKIRRDFISLPSWFGSTQVEPIGRHFKIPYGVPKRELPPLPALSASAPTVASGEAVPAMGIWVVEPDFRHRDQTYAMAYLRPWAPALATVSEQEYEKNTRWTRTRDEAFRKDSDKIKNYPVRWRLLWRDDRDYRDGNVPPEESEYLQFEGNQVQTAAPVVRLRCESGQPCPHAGTWFTPSRGGTRRAFAAGEIMPVVPSNWGHTIWQFESDRQSDQ